MAKRKGHVCAFSDSGACTPLCMEYNTCKRNPWKEAERKEKEKEKK